MTRTVPTAGPQRGAALIHTMILVVIRGAVATVSQRAADRVGMEAERELLGLRVRAALDAGIESARLRLNDPSIAASGEVSWDFEVGEVARFRVVVRVHARPVEEYALSSCEPPELFVGLSRFARPRESEVWVTGLGVQNTRVVELHRVDPARLLVVR
jgi:hypothetical protein